MCHGIGFVLRPRVWLAGVVLAALASAPWAARADNWPAWRRDGSGISVEKGVSTQWDAHTNILWQAAVPGEGNSSPIVWEGRTYLTSALDGGKKRLVLCYDAAGGEAWRREFAVAKPAGTYPKNGYASHTAVTDGQRVWAFFDDPGLVALNARTGEVDWQLPLGPFKTAGYLAASPILSRDLVIMVCDVDESTYDGKKQKGGFIVAVEQATGRERWRVARKSSANAATPLAIEVGGVPQIVVSGDPIVSYDARSGAVVWTCKGMKPMCAPSPVFDGTLVWAASGRNGPAVAIDPTGTGDVSETHATLVTDLGGPYVPSPLVCPYLLLPGDDGQITCVDKSGQTLLRTRVRGHFTASPVAAEGHVYWPDEKGRTYVLDAGQLAAPEPRLPVLASNDVGEAILASPAISKGRLYLRGAAHLFCIAGQAKVQAAATAPATQLPATLAELQQRYEQAPAGEGPGVAVRLDVVDALAVLTAPEVNGLLLRIAQKDPHWDVSEAAAKALADRGASAADALLQLLDDGREYPKIIAADALGQLQATAAAGKLAALAGDRNAFVRRAALRALGRVGRATKADLETIVPALTKGLADAEGPTKLVAIQALVPLAERVGTHRGEIVTALQTCAADRNVQVAKAAKDALTNSYR